MTAIITDQWRSISTYETSANSPLTVRTFARTAANINNWWRYVGNYPRLWMWPADGSAVTEVVTPSSASPTMMLYLGRHYFDRAYTSLRYYVQGRISTGSGTSVWTIWASTNLYTGDAVFDSDLLHASSYAQVTLSSTSWQIVTGTISIPNRTPDSYLYLHASAQNAAGSRSTLCSLTLQPEA